jgi:hypothetical protein
MAKQDVHIDLLEIDMATGNHWLSPVERNRGQLTEIVARNRAKWVAEQRAKRAKSETKGFDPNEPRDDAGKWTDGGGSDDAGSSSPASSSPTTPSGAPVVVFHGTTESVVKKIVKEGLHVTEASHHFDSDVYAGDRGESVFVTTNQKTAVDYASSHAQAESWKEYKAVTPVLFRLEVPPDEWKKFNEDKLEPESRYTKAIPPEWIKGVFNIKPDSSLEQIKSADRRVAADHVTAYMVIFVGEPKDKTEDKTEGKTAS